MTRAYQVFGEFIISVSGGQFSGKQELGLTSDPWRLHPRYVHRDVTTDGFGPVVPVETLWDMADALVSLTLVHYDQGILDQCMRAAMGGGGYDAGNPGGGGAMDGFLGQAGRPMGLGAALGSTENQYTTVYIEPTADGTILPYRFRACYLDGRPLEVPYGSERSLVKLNWRCIPYQPLTAAEISSVNGVPIWDRTSVLL